jgi:stearoyl-CoA desaturase (delta-9 desaturase)
MTSITLSLVSSDEIQSNFCRNISSANNPLVSLVAVGEGWHNYHHVFPWDYKASELPSYGLNVSTAVIDFFAAIGWATDLKTGEGWILQGF